MSLFKDKTLMITGGTGSFGNAVLNRFFDMTLMRKINTLGYSVLKKLLRGKWM